MSRAKIVDGVIVDGDSAADPLIGGFPLLRIAQFGDPSPASDASNRGVSPQREQNSRIDGGGSCLAFHGLDFAIQLGQIKPLDKSPDGSHGVIDVQTLVQRQHDHFDLTPIGTLEACLVRRRI